MKETLRPSASPQSTADGSARLLGLVDRSGPPPRPLGGLITDWYVASGASLPFAEWADPATGRLADVFASDADLDVVERAVVAFAEARAGADHTAEAVAADLVALVQLAWPSAGHEWSDWVDPVGLVARALGAWAIERDGILRTGGQTVDPVTGLVGDQYLRPRLRELHDQCRGLAISPAATFGAVVVQLELSAVAAPERIGVRVAAGRILAHRFHTGETVAVLGSDRIVAVMPAYGIDRALGAVQADLAGLAALDGVGLTIGRAAFADDADATFRSLAGTSVGS
jgi:hypothetical protein